jgi:hypothetical protein
MSDGLTRHRVQEMSETIKVLLDANERLRLQQAVSLSTLAALVECIVSQAAHHPRQIVLDGIRDRSLVFLTDLESPDSEVRNAQLVMDALFDQLARDLGLETPQRS